jgi:hypothetical protein
MKFSIGIILPALLFCFLTPRVAEANISIVGGLTHEKKAKAGETYRGVIFIKNSGEDPQEVSIYQTDYLFSCDGKNTYGEPGKDPRSNARWITFSPRRLVVQPGDRSEVTYTVKLPGDETLVGTYWSMLMVEGTGRYSPDAMASKTQDVNMGIRTVLRYGIQMVTNVGDTGVRKLKFLATKLLKENEEKRTLQVDIENVGERGLRPLLWTELYDKNGSYIGRFEGLRLRTYPGTSVRYRVDLSEVPEGKYKALIVADCGGDDIFGASYNLEFEK